MRESELLADEDALATRLAKVIAEEMGRYGMAVTPANWQRLSAAVAAQLAVAADNPTGCAAVVAALLRFGESHASPDPETRADFTVDPDVNALLRSDPFAFLLGVLFDQGMPAERAWEAPYRLRQRLGHLDPGRIAADYAAVHRAVNQPPKLHRYVEIMPRWVVSAAARVMRDYGGDARAIWADHPTAAELQRRFDAFVGIGQKKAAMAVEILARDYGVPIQALHGSDISYDVHVRRVLLRTGLAERDDRDHMVAVARAANPSRPGAIDLPAWLIGRQWCRPGVPMCASCPLTSVCPQQIARAATVRGA